MEKKKFNEAATDTGTNLNLLEWAKEERQIEYTKKFRSVWLLLNERVRFLSWLPGHVLYF